MGFNGSITNLYAPDSFGNLHLNLLGRFVATTTFYSTIFAKDPSGMVPPTADYPGLDPATVSELQSIIWSVVTTTPGTGVVALPGDFNQNGIVDAADYTVWRENVGKPAGTLANDPTGSTIGDAQFNVWKSNFGASSGGSSAGVVPEPSAIALLAFAPLTLWQKGLRRGGGQKWSCTSVDYLVSFVTRDVTRIRRLRSVA